MWLLLDWYDNKKWWLVKDDEVDCTGEQMRKAVEGYFSIESARIVSNKLPTVSRMVSSESMLPVYQVLYMTDSLKIIQSSLVHSV